MFWRGSLKVMNNHSFSNVNNKMFIQSYLVVNNVLKTLAQKSSLYIIHRTFYFWNVLVGPSSKCFLIIVSEHSEYIQMNAFKKFAKL